MIFLSDTPASLALVGAMLHELANPGQINVTLAYYLEPVFWQETDARISGILQELFEQEDALLADKQPVSPPLHFTKARTLLIEHGLAPERIHVEAHWHQPTLVEQRKSQLQVGAYSAVIIVRHHYDMLFGLMGVTLREVLNRYGHQVHIHILDLGSHT